MKADSQATKVYNEIRRKILSNQVGVGTRLKEDSWAKKLDVNRIAVREALTRLQGEQLIVPGEKGGYFVKSMTAADAKEIHELREILELGAIRLVMQKMTGEQLNKLEEICNDFTAMVERGYYGGACEADVKFHETLIDIAHNETLKKVYETSNIPLFHQKLSKTQIYMNDYEQTDQEHREIVRALKEKNLELAQEALKKHLLRGEVASLEIE